MITKGDEYPIHQTPEPIAYSGSNRDFYDRYFFNGYSNCDDVFFSMALGVYPHLNIKDAAFCLIVDGVQHNLRASAFLNMERMDMQVGPLGIEVVEPLKVIRISVHDNDHGLRADLRFTYNSSIVEEPRFTHRSGPRMMMDITRMTQNGSWDGFVEVAGRKVEVSSDNFVGTRDRSWGVRPIGTRDPQPMVPEPELQMFWYWAPINFGKHVTMFGLNETAEGVRWHQNAIRIDCQEGAQPQRYSAVDVTYDFRKGSRHQNGMALKYRDAEKGELEIKMITRYQFYMSGLGYGHPEWGHGCHRGELDVAYDTIALDNADPRNPLHFHIQAIVDAVMIYNGEEHQGSGVLEQMILGPHKPSGLLSGLDVVS